MPPHRRRSNRSSYRARRESEQYVVSAPRTGASRFVGGVLERACSQVPFKREEYQKTRIRVAYAIQAVDDEADTGADPPGYIRDVRDVIVHVVDDKSRPDMNLFVNPDDARRPQPLQERRNGNARGAPASQPRKSLASIYRTIPWCELPEESQQRLEYYYTRFSSAEMTRKLGLLWSVGAVNELMYQGATEQTMLLRSPHDGFQYNSPALDAALGEQGLHLEVNQGIVRVTDGARLVRGDFHVHMREHRAEGMYKMAKQWIIDGDLPDSLRGTAPFRAAMESLRAVKNPEKRKTDFERLVHRDRTLPTRMIEVARSALPTDSEAFQELERKRIQPVTNVGQVLKIVRETFCKIKGLHARLAPAETLEAAFEAKLQSLDMVLLEQLLRAAISTRDITGEQPLRTALKQRYLCDIEYVGLL